MRVRIIFRGLILFRFEKAEGGRRGNPPNRGTLKALLVSDPMAENMSGDTSSGMDMGGPAMSGHNMAGSQETPGTPMPSHVSTCAHVPRIGISGRDANTNRRIIETGIRLAPGETKIDLHGFARDGVSTTRGFDSYVPNLGKLRPTGRGKPRREFFKSWITVPHGRLRARDLVSWDEGANQPAEVAFMGTNFRGFVANEAVLDVGDDSDFQDDRKSKYLSIKSTTSGIPERLWPATKGTEYVDESDPNTVEILITNFAPQRRRAVFWSLHYESFFDAMGFARNLDYEKSAQYTKFVSAAKKFDRYEWNTDLSDMGVGQPFPYVIPESIKSLPGLKKDRVPAVIGRAPKDIEVRTKDDGIPKRTLESHDPWSRPICPLGQDDGGGGV